MPSLRVTILGCGSSAGVPRLGNDWGRCDPDDPRNARRRCSLLVEKLDGDRATRILIDTAPDLRAQLLDAGIGSLDAVAYTHAHADHVHGIDDLRVIVFNRRARLPVWADDETAEVLVNRFGYAFVQPEGSDYPAILDLHGIDGPFEVQGEAGPLTLRPFRVEHGRTHALGFRVGGLAYLPDVSGIPEPAWAELDRLECLIVDALRYRPHPTHSHLAQSLDWIARAGPRQAVLTNMHNDLDYATVARETPAHVTPAHDGMVLELPL